MSTKKILLFTLALITASYTLVAQELEKEQQLDSVIISSTRIDLPFSENSRTITIITSEDIKNSAANKRLLYSFLYKSKTTGIIL